MGIWHMKETVEIFDTMSMNNKITTEDQNVSYEEAQKTKFHVIIVNFKKKYRKILPHSMHIHSSHFAYDWAVCRVKAALIHRFKEFQTHTSPHTHTHTHTQIYIVNKSWQKSRTWLGICASFHFKRYYKPIDSFLRWLCHEINIITKTSYRCIFPSFGL